MKITTTIEKSALKEINKYIMPTIVKRNNKQHFIIALLIIIVSFFNKLHVLTIIGIMALIIDYILYKKQLKTLLQKNITFFEKLYPEGNYTITIEFKDNKLVYINHKYRRNYSIEYKDINKIYKSKNHYIITTNSDTYIAMNKNDVTYKNLKKNIKKR